MYGMGNSTMVAQPSECSSFDVATSCNTPYELGNPNYSVGNLSVTAQPIECPPVNVTMPRNSVYGEWYPNWSVEDSGTIDRPMDDSPFDLTTPCNMTHDPPSSTSSIQNQRDAIIQSPCNADIYGVIDRFLRQRRNILWDEVESALAEHLNASWQSINGMWYRRKRKLEESGEDNLSCLFKK
jgi:hypothetical protein